MVSLSAGTAITAQLMVGGWPRHSTESIFPIQSGPGVSRPHGERVSISGEMWSRAQCAPGPGAGAICRGMGLSGRGLRNREARRLHHSVPLGSKGKTLHAADGGGATADGLAGPAADRRMDLEIIRQGFRVSRKVCTPERCVPHHVRSTPAGRGRRETLPVDHPTGVILLADRLLRWRHCPCPRESARLNRVAPKPPTSGWRCPS